MGNGKLDPEAIRLYRAIGSWMKLNGESLLDTRPNPLPERPTWGDVSMNKTGNVLYLHILSWPETGTIALNDLPVNAIRASQRDPGHLSGRRAEGRLCPRRRHVEVNASKKTYKRIQYDNQSDAGQADIFKITNNKTR
jgi:hypothetical protein